MIKRRTLVLMLLLPSGGALADDFLGQASFVDGDTLEIHGIRIRLWGVDAPESGQLCRETVCNIVVARRQQTTLRLYPSERKASRMFG
jgi:endonuclease YncB( thermonuclease family)